MRHPEIDPNQRLAAAALAEARRLSRGQVMAIFAGSLIALMLLSAMVVDLGWYWSNGLKIQRAADAAALAGAVYLPDNFNGAAPNAQTAALAAAKRNGYVPGAGTTIVPTVDTNNPRQLNVTITDKVGTYFMKVIGIQTINASRSSKAEFVLPVPMGSPQNYYGVGTLLGFTALPPLTTNYTNPPNYNPATQTSGLPPSTFTAGGPWATAGNVYTTDGKFATSNVNGNQEVWQGWTFGAFQGGAFIDGLVVNINAKAAGGTACQLKTEVSWDAGVTWGTSPQTTAALTTTLKWYVQGSTTDEAIWSANHVSWATGDFDPGHIQVRVTYLRPTTTCGKASIDEITAVVYSHTVTTYPRKEVVQPVFGPTGTNLPTQGFWGADITVGGDRPNGDQFGPSWDSQKNQANPDFDGKGVDYSVVIAGANGQVQLFDPTFCETGLSSGGGNYGTGDHWIAGGAYPVTTVYSLFDQNGTPYDISDDIAYGTSGTLFANKTQADYSGDFGSPQHNGLPDCQNDPYHNAWYTLDSGLPAGNYRLNVTTNVAGNTGTNAENMWSAWVSSTTGNSQVYGQGKMVTYNNLVSGVQLFYLAQIDKVHASKTMEIKLFDPGDVSGNAYLKILSPDGNAYNYQSFTWTADNGRSGSGTQIQTASSSTGTYFQDALITIEIPLPVTYGSGGLTPPGETGAGWWKIEYTVAGGNDTTTWQVDIQGNPVHLLVP